MTKFVCLDCVTDEYLQELLAGNSPGTCSYCDQEAPVIELDELAELCKEAISGGFQVVEQSMAVIHHGYDPVGDPLPSVLDKILGAQEAIIYDLSCEVLDVWDDGNEGDPHFIEETFASSSMQSQWHRMECSLREEARLINPIASTVLEGVFGSVHFRSLGGSCAIRTIGPGCPLTALQRARVFSSEEDVAEALSHPELYLGPPPPGVAASGRMNARGVSVFYGATHEEIAIAEVRPPVGSFVVTATFEIIRPLRLLVLDNLSLLQPDIGLSYFDPVRMEEAQRCAFLKELQGRLLIPVMPELADQGYLITQAIADFLSTHREIAVDGISFPSMQFSTDESHDPGHNVILFNKACGVLRVERKYATRSVDLYEWEEDGKWFRPQIWSGEKPAHHSRRRDDVRDTEDRPPSPRVSLELDRDRIHVHHVQGVKFAVVSYEVNQEREG